MNTTLHRRSHGPGGSVFRSTPAVVLMALALCAAFDCGLLWLIRSGPPSGKSDFFFTELVALGVGSILASVASVLNPGRARVAIPYLLLALGWHTGLELSFSDQWPAFVSAIDVLIPVILFLALMGGWSSDTRTAWLTRAYGLRLWIFAGFLAWGLALGFLRGVDQGALAMNFKAFALYPLLPLIMLWCIQTWKQLYASVGALILLVFERAVVGLTSPAANQSTSILSTGKILTRTNGDFASVNQFAFYLLSGLLIAVAVAVASRRSALRLVLIVPIALMSLAMVNTYSRGAYAGVAAGLVMLGLLLPRRQGLSLIGIVVLLGGGIVVMHPSTASNVTTRLNPTDHSAQERLTYLQTGVDVLKAYPLGAGWGAAFIDSSRGLQADHSPDTDWPWYHDDYLQLATEIGVLGLLVFLSFWWLFARAGWSAFHTAKDSSKKALVAGLMAALAGMLVQAFTDQFFWRTDIGPHIWMVAGLLLVAVTLVRQDRTSKNPLSSTVNPAAPQRVAVHS